MRHHAAIKAKLEQVCAETDRVFGVGESATAGYVLLAFPLPLRGDGTVECLTMSNLKPEAIVELVAIVHNAHTQGEIYDQ
jgi:hypothetical protein